MFVGILGEFGLSEGAGGGMMGYGGSLPQGEGDMISFPGLT